MKGRGNTCRGQVRGQMETAEGLRLERPILVGKWDEAMYADVGEATLRLLWKMNPPPPEPTRSVLRMVDVQISHDVM